jgi:4-amino-4-deoxy-L-arabinose transferase-like glycosyltransferase
MAFYSRTMEVGAGVPARGLRWPLALAAAGGLAALLRVLFRGMPLTSDEGGFGVIVRLWRDGAELYDEAWVDRPQGLLLLFRGVLAVSDSADALRAAAVVVALLVLVASALVARKLIGEKAAIIAVFLLATAGASPFIESFTLAGELAASLFAVCSLLAFLTFLERRDLRFAALAGLLTGCAMLMKQSGFDAGLAAVAYLLWKERARRGVRAAGAFAVAALVPVVVAAAAAPDLGNWWYAVVTYRFEGDSIVTDSPATRLLMLAIGLRPAALALAVPLVLAIGGWRSSPLLLRLWLVAALVGVAGGGNFWRHYWIQIVPPLAMIAAVRLKAMLESGDLRRPLRALPLAVAVAFSLWVTVPLLFADKDERVRRAMSGDVLRVYDDDIVAYVRSHTAPGERVAIIPTAGGSIQFLADRPPAFRYLWFGPARSIPGAVPELRSMLRDDPPALVVVLADPRFLDPSGETTAILRTRYRVVERIGPTVVVAPRR